MPPFLPKAPPTAAALQPRSLLRAQPPAAMTAESRLRSPSTKPGRSEEHKGGRYGNRYVFESARTSGVRIRQKL